MTSKEHLINQHILEYEARLKKIDELLEQDDDVAVTAESEQTQQLHEFKQKRDELDNYVNSVKTMSVENWKKEELEMAGPMGVWDAVAQQIEKMVEGKK